MSTRGLIPIECLPGFKRWGNALEAMLTTDAPILVHGESGTGVSFLGAWLAAARKTEFLDDAEKVEDLEGWIRAHPMGVLGAHRAPHESDMALHSSRCIVLRLPSLNEDPDAMPSCLESLARVEGLEGPFPSALAALPCPGNLLGLRNRLLRWKLLGQLPDESSTAGLVPLEAEDMATNLHALERILLHRALRRSYGNRVEAARRLGVSRRQLYLLVARHGDPVRGDAPICEGPKRLKKQRNRQNSSAGQDHR